MAVTKLLSRIIVKELDEVEEGNEEENQDADGNNNGNAQQNNGYYGYGYYNSYGEWVSSQQETW